MAKCFASAFVGKQNGGEVDKMAASRCDVISVITLSITLLSN